MTKTFSKTFLFLLILFAISCGGNDITGGGGGGGGGIISQPPDNRVPTETETEISKDFLQNTFNKYSKGKVVEYGGESYTFDSDAKMTVNGQQYTFWGMSPEDNSIAYYYYYDKSSQQEPQFMQVSSQKDETDNIIGIEKKDISSSAIVDKMKNTIFNQDPKKTEIDYKKLKPQTTTPAANEWKNKVNGKSMGGFGKFEANGNLVFSYNGGSETYNFWGATNIGGSLYGLYYSYDGENTNYPMSLTLSKSELIEYESVGHSYSGLGLIMHPKKDAPDTTDINTPQTTSPKANEWKDKIKNQSYNTYYNSDTNATYRFDASGNLTITYKAYRYDSSGNLTGSGYTTNETFTFWGAIETNFNYGGYETDSKLYGLYYKYYYYDDDYSRYESCYFYFDKNYDGSGDEILRYSSIDTYNGDGFGFIMHPKKDAPDKTKINTPQTTSPKANEWKNKINGKTLSGTYGYDSDNNATYTFDASGNLTIKYKTYRYDSSGVQQEITTNEPFTFWGAVETNMYGGGTTLYGLYYNYTTYQTGVEGKDTNTNYTSIALSLISAGSVIGGNIDENELADIMFEKKVGYDYDKPKPSTSSSADSGWKTKIAAATASGQPLQETYITHYTFELGGDVSVKGGRDNDNFKYKFFGAKDETNAIYYKEVNLRDMFDNYAPDTKRWEYYGITLDTDNSKFNVYSVSNTYRTELENWFKNYFDSSGKPNNSNIWNFMPVQKKDDIDWYNPLYEGDLIK